MMFRRLLICWILLIISFQGYCQVDLFENLLDSTYLVPASGGKRPGVVNEQGAMQRYRKATESGNEKQLAVASGILGSYYLRNGNLPKAEKYIRQSIEVHHKNGNINGEAVAIAQMATVYLKQLQYEKSLKLFDQSLSMMASGNFVKGTGPVAFAASSAAIRIKDLTRAGNYLSQALNAFKISGNNNAIADIYNRSGEIELTKNNFKGALDYFNKAVELLPANDKKRQALVQRNIGLVYFKKGDFETALDYFNISLGFDQQLLVSKLKKEALMKLFTIHSFNRDFDNADIYHELYRGIKDSIAGLIPEKESGEDEKQNIIAMLERRTQEQQLMLNQRDLELSSRITETDIERQNKEKALEALQESSTKMEQLTREGAIRQRDLARKELQLSRQTSFRNMLILLIGVIVIFSWFIYKRYRERRKDMTQLEKANTELAGTLEELHRMQDQLIHQEKLASLGQMTAGIAHEIKNPLNFISNFSSVSAEMIEELKSTTDKNEMALIIDDLKGNLHRIMDHSMRADSIVKNMLMHTRNTKQEKVLTDMNVLLENTFRLCYQSLKVKGSAMEVTIQYSLDPSLPSVKIDVQEIERVFINIFENAFYAMEKRKKANPAYHPVINAMTSDILGWVTIKISDNASGIPADIIKNIFQPFFTTKPAGEGTGLGLSLSYDIITRGHSGSIEAKSIEGEGTIFTIKLPVA